MMRFLSKIALVLLLSISGCAYSGESSFPIRHRGRISKPKQVEARPISNHPIKEENKTEKTPKKTKDTTASVSIDTRDTVIAISDRLDSFKATSDPLTASVESYARESLTLADNITQGMERGILDAKDIFSLVGRIKSNASAILTFSSELNRHIRKLEDLKYYFDEVREDLDTIRKVSNSTSSGVEVNALIANANREKEIALNKVSHIVIETDKYKSRNEKTLFILFGVIGFLAVMTILLFYLVNGQKSKYLLGINSSLMAIRKEMSETNKVLADSDKTLISFEDVSDLI